MSLKVPSSSASAFVSHVVLTYGSQLHRFLMRRLGRREDAADVAQEVYLRLLRLQRTELIRKPAAYVYLVAAQVAAEHRLRERSQPVALDSEVLERLTDMSAVTSAEGEPGELVDVDRELQRLLRKLQVTHRNVLILRKRDGLSNREIAASLNLSEHTVKKYLFQAMAQLSVLRKNRKLERTSDE